MPRRGEIWLVRLDPVVGSEIRKTRPCLVVGTDILNERRRTVIVVPLSSSPQASPPILVPLACAGRRAVAVIDQIRAVSKERFDSLVDSVTGEELAAVEGALREVLDLP